MKRDKKPAAMPPVIKKLGPGVTLRPRKGARNGAQDGPGEKLDYTPSEQVFRRAK